MLVVEPESMAPPELVEWAGITAMSPGHTDGDAWMKTLMEQLDPSLKHLYSLFSEYYCISGFLQVTLST